jgi:hypothetical protein
MFILGRPKDEERLQATFLDPASEQEHEEDNYQHEAEPAAVAISSAREAVMPASVHTEATAEDEEQNQN